MLTRIAVAAAAVLLTFGSVSARDQEELALSLTCKPPSFKARAP